MSSRSSTIGALALGKQSAKGTVATTWSWMPVTSLNVQAQQQTNTLAPEVGGDHFLRGSYKAGVAASGDFGFQVRPNSIGHLLYMLCGTKLSSANSAAPTLADPTDVLAGAGASGPTLLAAGDYTIAYTLINGTGETRLSPLTTVTITAGQKITTTALPTIPVGATGVNFYMSQSAGSSNLGFVGTNVDGGVFNYTTYGNGQYPPAANTTGGTGDGSYTHVFNPFAPAANTDLPWYSLVKDVSKLYYEQFVDMKLSSLRFDISKQSVITGSASVFGITPQELDGSALSEVFDSTNVFQACTATVSLVDETGDITLTADDVKAERISFDFGNQLSQDEYTVGSYVPADVTLLQRTGQISYDVVIRDPDLRRAVYQAGVAPVGGAGSVAAWSPKIFRGSLNVNLISNDKVPGSNNVYSLKIIIPGLDFMMMPVQLSGAQLIRANLSAQITLGTTGLDKYRFELVNGVATY